MPDPAVLDIDPFSRSFLSNPNQYYAQMRDAGPVLYFPDYELASALVV